MTDLEALEIVRDRVRQKGSGSDAELEQAFSILERAILSTHSQALAAAGALTSANEDDRIFGAACDAADSIRDEDVKKHLEWLGFTDLAQSSTDEDVIDAVVGSVHDLLLPLTEKDSQGYFDVVEGAARILVERAGLDWDEAMKLKLAEMRNARRPG